MGGKPIELRAEYDDRSEAEFRQQIYAELKQMAADLQRKAGFAAVFYRDIFGAWPSWEWVDTVEPFPPRIELHKLDKRRHNRWKRERDKKRNGDAGAKISESDAAAAGESGSARGASQVEG